MSRGVPPSLLHYEIVDLIGRGAMGEVYRATDTKLGRDVALKILPADTAAFRVRLERFEREARTVAGLNHPNIVTLHSVEETGGIHFITMELVEGAGLDTRVVPGGCPLEEVVAIGIAVGEALEAAHARGVVHRDLKPANIMQTPDGRLKVLDFGLAKLAADEPDELATMDLQLTNAGAIVGTVPYLSPEQARGEPADTQADLWALGVILFELLAGRRPFGGDNTAAILHDIGTGDPPSLTDLRPGIPEGIAGVVARALARDGADRYRRASDLVADLRRVGRDRESGSTTRAAPVLPGLAVLPFSGLRPDPETDYLGFALADQIIGALAYVKSLRIKPSTAVRRYDGRPADPAEVARDLHVDYVLTGSYLKVDATVRLNVELVKAAVGELVWRETIQVEFDNVFALQDIVADKVVKGLEVQFPDEARERLEARAPADPVAYDLYLRSLSSPHTVEGDSGAIGMLRQSLALDDAFAPAHAALGFRLRSFALQAIKGAAVYEEAGVRFQRALALDDGHLPALAGLAGLKGDLGRFDEALPLLKRMFEVNPNHALGHYVLHSILRATGQLEASKRVGQRALELDPGNPNFRNLAYVHFYSGDYHRAIELFNLDPESYLSICWIGFAKFMLGAREEGERMMWKGVEHEPDGHLGHHFGALVHGWRGEFAPGRELAARWEATDPFDPESLYNMANTWAVLEDEAACVRIMEKVVRDGFCCYRYMMSDPLMEKMREVPAIQDLLEQARIKFEAFGELYRASGLPESDRV